MRIAHVANFYSPQSGGLRTTMHSLGTEYLNAGHKYLMIVPGNRFHLEQTVFGTRVTLPAPVIPKSGGYRAILRIPEVKHLLSNFHPDIVEVSDRTTLKGLGKWSRKAGIPSIFFAHERLDGVIAANLGPRIVTRPIVRKWQNNHLRSLSRDFSAVVCTTNYAAAEFAALNLPHRIIPLGVDLAQFTPAARDPELIAKYAPNSEKLILLASRLSTEKAPELALQAVRELQQAGHSLRLVSLGTGALADRLKDEYSTPGFCFLGFAANRQVVAKWLASADLVVAPGPIETFGLAALEALASGTMVVANGDSALPEVVGAGGLSAPNSVPGFKAAILAALAINSTTRQARARERAEQFSWGHTAAQLLGLYRNLRDGDGRDANSAHKNGVEADRLHPALGI